MDTIFGCIKHIQSTPFAPCIARHTKDNKKGILAKKLMSTRDINFTFTYITTRWFVNVCKSTINGQCMACVQMTCSTFEMTSAWKCTIHFVGKSSKRLWLKKAFAILQAGNETALNFQIWRNSKQNHVLIDHTSISFICANIHICKCTVSI